MTRDHQAYRKNLSHADAKKLQNEFICGHCFGRLKISKFGDEWDRWEIYCEKCGREAGFIDRDAHRVAERERAIFERDCEKFAGIKGDCATQEERIRKLYGD